MSENGQCNDCKEFFCDDLVQCQNCKRDLCEDCLQDHFDERFGYQCEPYVNEGPDPMDLAKEDR